MFSLNQRVVDINNYKATIRYIGLLPLENDSKIWYGLEWDDDTRGKNNGSIKDKQGNMVRIFSCPDGCGSFVRVNKIFSGISIEEALLERYDCCELDKNDEKNDQTMIIEETMDNKKINQEQSMKIQSELRGLTSIILDNDKISSIRGDLGELCPNVKEININNNLIPSADFILSLMNQCPNLESLYISNNMFSLPFTKSSIHSHKRSLQSLMNDSFEETNEIQDTQSYYTHLKMLSLGRCNMTWVEVENLVSFFPQLEYIYLHGNNLSFNTSMSPVSFSSLKYIDLSHCGISSWEFFSILSSLPSLQTLTIADNQLDDSISSSLPCLSSLESIDINNNPITSLQSLYSLFLLCPSLHSLLCVSIPFYTQQQQSTLAREEIIASFGCLISLNNSEISSKERTESEIYFLKHWLLKCMEEAGCRDINDWNILNKERQTELLSKYPRYSELVCKYGDPVIKVVTNTIPKTINATSILLSFQYCDSGKIIKKKFPIRTTMKQIKQVICKLLKCEPSKTIFYNTRDEYHEPMDSEGRSLQEYEVQDGDTIYVQETDTIQYHV
ncbi:hypothetical protein WA158_001940 [Blastocystis sp. Blastoise]